MTIRHITVFSRAEAERTSISGRHAYISLADSDQPPADLPVNEGTVDVLRLHFDDVIEEGDKGRPITAFDTAHAGQILDFWGSIQDQADQLVIHCNGGQCRSPAVAAALERIMTGSDDRWFRMKRPNIRVYRLLLETYHERLDATEQGA